MWPKQRYKTCGLRQWWEQCNWENNLCFFQRTSCENNKKNISSTGKKKKIKVSAYKVISKNLAMQGMWPQNNLRLPFSPGTIGVLAKKNNLKKINPEPHYLGGTQSFIWLPLNTCLKENKFVVYIGFISLFPAKDWEAVYVWNICQEGFLQRR